MILNRDIFDPYGGDVWPERWLCRFDDGDGNEGADGGGGTGDSEGSDSGDDAGSGGSGDGGDSSGGISGGIGDDVLGSPGIDPTDQDDLSDPAPGDAGSLVVDPFAEMLEMARENIARQSREDREAGARMSDQMAADMEEAEAFNNSLLGSILGLFGVKAEPSKSGQGTDVSVSANSLGLAVGAFAPLGVGFLAGKVGSEIGFPDVELGRFGKSPALDSFGRPAPEIAAAPSPAAFGPSFGPSFGDVETDLAEMFGDPASPSFGPSAEVAEDFGAGIFGPEAPAEAPGSFDQSLDVRGFGLPASKAPGKGEADDLAAAMLAVAAVVEFAA